MFQLDVLVQRSLGSITLLAGLVLAGVVPGYLSCRSSTSFLSLFVRGWLLFWHYLFTHLLHLLLELSVFFCEFFDLNKGICTLLMRLRF